MKKKSYLGICCLCLFLAGCGSRDIDGVSAVITGNDQNEESSYEEETEMKNTDKTAPWQDTSALEPIAQGSRFVPGPSFPGESGAGKEGTPVAYGGTGKARTAYRGRENSAVYISSAEELKKYAEAEGLEKYDDSFFQDHALVLVKDTVNSGSVKIEIQSMKMDGDNIWITLSRSSASMGTADMATWVLWAEVDTGLEGYAWKVANPASPSDQESR